MSGGLKGVRASVRLGLTAVSKWLLSSEQQRRGGGVCVVDGTVKGAGLNLHSEWEECCGSLASDIAARGCFHVNL